MGFAYCQRPFSPSGFCADFKIRILILATELNRKGHHNVRKAAKPCQRAPSFYVPLEFKFPHCKVGSSSLRQRERDGSFKSTVRSSVGSVALTPQHSFAYRVSSAHAAAPAKGTDRSTCALRGRQFQYLD